MHYSSRRDHQCSFSFFWRKGGNELLQTKGWRFTRGALSVLPFHASLHTLAWKISVTQMQLFSFLNHRTILYWLFREDIWLCSCISSWNFGFNFFSFFLIRKSLSTSTQSKTINTFNFFQVKCPSKHHLNDDQILNQIGYTERNIRKM